MSPTVSSVIGIVQKLLPSEDNDDRDEDEDYDSDDFDMFYIVEDDHGSISVTSEDIIGESNAFFGDSPSPGVGTRKSLIADTKGRASGNPRRASRSHLAGSLMRG